ncbi:MULTISPECIES: DNA-binding protein [Paraburkholderia]|uniref:DNA-binding protein n=1 Tax=Paraburkholderia TaxID=1822464 RepID=UPI00225C2558|nr:MULTISPECIES: DNA-binding protein [Paraburkholderia]MCX4177841.1 DNA-binding protein [Paraburkholderia madseniana]MDQ6465828.1 DNA-binding protein [Paraburkholderia madseniana]
MSRPAAISADQIRTTVLAMLAEADVNSDHPPPTPERFRKVISVRKLRARLGAGDPAMLSRALNTIEVEVVRAGLAQVAIPGLPDPIAEQMRTLWHAAVTVQLDEVARLREEATQAAEASDAARRDADLRTEMLRVELAELRAQLSTRDSELANLRADCRSLTERAETLSASAAGLQAELDAVTATLAQTRQAHADEFAAVHARYEGLSRQLLQETEHQRHALQTERERLSGQITQAQERVAALEGLRDRLLTELAGERNAHQRAAAEAAALATVAAEHRALLQAVHATPRHPAKPAPVRHRRTPAATPSPTPASSPARRKAR